GVSRHQDRQDKGWAVSPADHAQDLALIQEMGANTIRLAHYQHAQHFYDLCDKAGMVLWAEIPFISLFMKGEKARADTLHQMTELIVQNYNHPSICFWGISNEITIGGECEELFENLKALNALAKQLDPGRLTTMAQLCMLDIASPHNQITDVLSYNHYFGWYMGTVEENGPWLDRFHKEQQSRALGVSEYGCEGILQWHSATPECHDYTEEYQAYYHEEMLKTFAARPYLWATHVWNMFDFAADARDEGGCKGRNNKGLVTYDRAMKKDAFYVYQAFWTTDAFVHVCGRRFTDRAPDERDIKVYSNCPAVTLWVNGAQAATLTGDKIFVFKNVALAQGANSIVAKAAGAAEDAIILNGVAQPNPAYRLPQGEDTDAGNWFEGLAAENRTLEFKEGFFSIRDKIGDLLSHPQTEAVL
ncbi:MAG: glycoside hydrolase family 2 TIM barrel-domain containing protein, partial [Ruthenibacterium sp.]